ncbi:MAG TPA: DUF4139 domain-containing protein [Kiritimatiellia bacterium]|nr:DUF4139 domain-containing protein [Kiritimatiellia bacterium]HRZ11784.1 DUF4139 domain-containing protein [Kiritimatiellia bacterium]HSA17410.1 DUF4139 domain-containing protein [Kiritimatiellia bacterium]
MKAYAWVVLLAGCASAAAEGLPEVEASAPRGVILSIYDTGQTLVSDLRSATLAKGDNRVRFGGLPALLDPASVSLGAVGGATELTLNEQSFVRPPEDLAGFLARYQGRPAEVAANGGISQGQLLAAAESSDRPAVLLQADDGSVSLFPDPAAIERIRVPSAVPGPALTCLLSSPGEGPANLRMWYTTRGLAWEASYEMQLDEGAGEAELLLRAALHNRSGGDFENARVRLVTTTQGRQSGAPGAASRLPGEEVTTPFRYARGLETPVPESSLAPTAQSALDVPGVVALPSGGARYVQLARAAKLPVRRFYIYDGVRFDRFQRNRRTDWNFGTEFHREVDLRIGFDNTEAAGLGFVLPPGRLRLYTRRADGTADGLVEGRLAALDPGASADVSLGPARGLSGERERTGYNEIVPLREYEESFEIRLANRSADEVEIRVVEHVYRGGQFEIVKSDADYTMTGEQTLEFRPTLKPGGDKSIHYTVRYRW